tara:strand:- start:183 stop:488 length:306 start_codon:yes stop_codon:yes gene_type:complete
MKELLLKLLTYLFQTFGKTSPLKNKGVGYLIWEPTTFAQDKVDEALTLAEKLGWTLLCTDEVTYYQGKKYPPHIFIGPAKRGHDDVDAALAHAIESFGLKD